MQQPQLLLFRKLGDETHAAHVELIQRVAQRQSYGVAKKQISFASPVELTAFKGKNNL